VRKHLFVYLAVLLIAVSVRAQQGATETSSASQFLGAWSGTWEAAGPSGGFELVLEKSSDSTAGAGAIGGRVDVSGEPTYKATLKKVTIDGKKMTALYDFPLDDQLEVTLNGTLDGDSIKGTWVVGPQGGRGGSVAEGVWNVKKK